MIKPSRISTFTQWARKALVIWLLSAAPRAQATVVVLDEAFSKEFSVTADAPEVRGVLTFSGWDDRLGTLRSVTLYYNPTVAGSFTLTTSNPISDGVLLARNEIKLTLNFDVEWGDSPTEDTAWFTTFGPSGVGTRQVVGDVIQIPADSVTSSILAPPPIGVAYKAGAVTVQKAAGVGLTGSWDVVLQGSYNRSYDTKTTDQYILDALIIARTEGRPKGEFDDVIAQKAYADVARLRSTDAGTSAQNVELRNAEYFIRGWRGAYSMRTMTPVDIGNLINEIGDRGGPYSTIAYNALKLLKGEQIGGAGQLPATPPGGLKANMKGYLQGATRSLDEVISDLSGGVDPPAPQPVVQPLFLNEFKIGDGDYQSVTYYIPDSTTPPAARLSGDLAVQSAPINPSITLEVTNELLQSWVVYGNRFTSLSLPSEYAALGGLEIAFDDVRFDITGSTFFDFLTQNSEGVSAFRLFLDANATLPATSVFEFGLMTEGEYLIGAVIGDIQPVPEPIAGAFLFSGAGLFLARRRRVVRC